MRLIEEPKEGYGSALLCGIRNAKGKSVIMGDCDDSYNFENLYPFLTCLRENYDLVIGNRFQGGIEKGAMSFSHHCFSPFIISDIITMYLNYVKFGNVFEFGITYQLGILDNHYSKFNIMSVINGIYAYLFRVPIFDTVFPYVFNNNSMFEYIGFYFNTTTGNGILPMSIFGLIAPFIVKKTDQETNKFIMVCLILGIIILCIDSMFGGSLKRYSIEFAWLFLIPMILIIIKYFKNKKLIILFVLISCFMNFLVIFDLKYDDNIPIDNRNLYYELMYF